MKKSKIQKMLVLALAVTMVAGSALTASAASSSTTAPIVSTATAEAAVAATTNSVPSTSSVTVNGVKLVTTVKGAYAAKTIDGIAVTTPAATVSAALGLTAGQTPYILVMDTDPVKSSKAMDSLKAAAAALTAEMGPVINIDLGFRENGAFHELEANGKTVSMTVAIPAEFQNAEATYAVICVRYGGAITVMADTDTDAATVTFDTEAGLGCYAIVRY